MGLKALEIVGEEFEIADQLLFAGLVGATPVGRSDLFDLEKRIKARIEEECGTTPYESERIKIQERSRCHDCTSGYRCEKHA